jgi:nucleotide-binding universal stress UspA family protein
MNEIIVGVDGSDTAKKAASEAATVANALGRTLHIVMGLPATGGATVQVVPGDAFHIDATSTAEQTVQSVAGEIGAKGPITYAVVPGDPAKALVSEAERLEASMIVVGNRRVQGFARVLGSIATDVARHAPCSVLIVHTV